jgi:hypothetical protein
MEEYLDSIPCYQLLFHSAIHRSKLDNDKNEH